MPLRMPFGSVTSQNDVSQNDVSENDVSQNEVRLGLILPWIPSNAFCITSFLEGILSNVVLTNVRFILTNVDTD